MRSMFPLGLRGVHAYRLVCISIMLMLLAPLSAFAIPQQSGGGTNSITETKEVPVVKKHTISTTSGDAPIDVSIEVVASAAKQMRIETEQGEELPGTVSFSTNEDNSGVFVLETTFSEGYKGALYVYLKNPANQWIKTDVEFSVNFLEKPKTTPTPKPTSKPIPAACILEQSPRGISIQIPELAHSGISEIDIYRTSENGHSSHVATLDYPNETNYVDESPKANEKYSYYYSVKCVCTEQFPESQKASIHWTKYSQPSNLKIRSDPDDIRTFHISWDDIPGAAYYVMIYQVDDNGEIGLWEWEEENGLCTSTSMSFHKALPRTTYVISIHDSITGAMLKETFTVPPAPDYTRYGADCEGGTMYWFKRSDLDKGKNPWDSGAKIKKYSTISIDKFAEMLEDYAFYGKSKFTYHKKSSDHYFNALYILRGPQGEVVYEEETDNYLEGYGANYWWEWHYPLKTLIRQLSGKNTLTEPGKYMFEVYFDGCRVSRKEFELTE